MEPTCLQMTKIITLITRFSRITGRTNKEVADALMATKTLRSLGQKGDGVMTYEQADAAIAILESWIRRKRERQFS